MFSLSTEYISRNGNYIETGSSASTVPGAMLQLSLHGENQMYLIEVRVSNNVTHTCKCKHKTCDFMLAGEDGAGYNFTAFAYDMKRLTLTGTFDTEIFYTNTSYESCLKGETLMMDVMEGDPAIHAVKTHPLDAMTSPPPLTGNKLLFFYPRTKSACPIANVRSMNMTLYRIPLEDHDLCISLEHMAKVDLSVYLNRLHRTDLPLSMDVGSLDVPLEVLAPDMYLICLKIKYTVINGEPSTLCGKFTKGSPRANNVSTESEYILRDHSTSPRSYVSWPASERLTLSVDDYFYLFETEDSGYRGSSTVKYSWKSVSTLTPTAGGGTCSALPVNVAQNTEHTLVIPGYSVMAGAAIYCVMCTITAGEDSRSSRDIEFSIHFTESHNPYIYIKCVLNCYSWPDRHAPMLLKAECPADCTSYDPGAVRVVWTVLFQDKQQRYTDNSLYQMIKLDSYMMKGVKYLEVKAELTYSSSSFTYTGHAWTRVDLPEVVQEDRSLVPDDIIGGHPGFDMYGLPPAHSFYREVYHMPNGIWNHYANRVTIKSTYTGKQYVVSRYLTVPSRIALDSDLNCALVVSKSTADGQTFARSEHVCVVGSGYSATNILEIYEQCLDMSYHELSYLTVIFKNFTGRNDNEKHKLIDRVIKQLEVIGTVHFGNIDVVLHVMKSLLAEQNNCKLFIDNTNDGVDLPILRVIAVVFEVVESINNEVFEDLTPVYTKIIDIMDSLTLCIQSSNILTTAQLVHLEYNMIQRKHRILSSLSEKYALRQSVHSLVNENSSSSVLWLDPFKTTQDIRLVRARLIGSCIREEVSYLFFDPFFTIVAHRTKYPTLQTNEYPLPPVLLQLSEKVRALGRKRRQNRLVKNMYNIDFDLEIPKENSKCYDVSHAGTVSDCVFLEIDPSEKFASLLHITTDAYSKVLIKSKLDKSMKDIIYLSDSDGPVSTKNLHLMDQFTKASEHRSSRYHVMVELTGHQTTNTSPSVEVNCVRLRCGSWDVLDQKWAVGYCLPGDNFTDLSTFTCVCDGGSVFSAGSSPCQAKMIKIDDLELIPTGFLLENSRPVLLVVAILLVSLFLLYWAVYNDQRTSHERQVHTMGYTNFQTNQYIVCIDSRHTTTSTVSVTLIGHLRIARRTELCNANTIFQNGNEVWMLLTARYPLGRLRSVVLSIDCRGLRPKWECSRLFIRHVNSGQDFFCDVKESLPNGDFYNVKYTIKTVTTTKPPHSLMKTFLRMMQKYHILVSVVYGKSSIHHTRVKHVLVSCLSLLTTMMISIFATAYEFEFSIPPFRRLTTEYAGIHDKVDDTQRVLRASVIASLIAAPLCTLTAWLVGRSRPRERLALDPFPQIVGPSRRIAWYPKMSEADEPLPTLPPVVNHGTVSQSSARVSSDGSHAVTSASTKNISPQESMSLPDSHDALSIEGTSSNKEVTTTSTSPGDEIVTKASTNKEDSSRRASNTSTRRELLDKKSHASSISSSLKSFNTIPSMIDETESQHSEDYPRSKGSRSDDGHANTEIEYRDSGFINSTTTDNDVSQNAWPCHRKHGEDEPCGESLDGAEDVYDFAREAEVPSERYAEPEDTSADMRQQEAELTNQWSSSPGNSRSVCELMVFAISLKVLTVVLYASTYTPTGSRLYCMVSGYSIAITFLIFQPALCVIGSLSRKARLRSERKNTADEITKARTAEMGIGLAGAQSGWFFQKKHVGTSTLHWWRKWSSVRILNRFRHSQQKKHEDRPDNNNQVNILVLFLLAVIVTVYINIQIGFRDRYKQTRFNVDFLGANSTVDDAYSIDQFWTHIQTMYTTLRDTRGKLDTTQDVRLLSSVRLRQMRRINQTRHCSDFQKIVHPLCRQEDGYVFDTDNYTGSWETVAVYEAPYPTPFMHTPASFLANAPLVGDRVATETYDYPSGGYDYILPLESDDTELFDRLKVLNWMDGRSQLVRLDFTLYMPDTGLATNFVITYEFTAIAIFQETFTYTYFLFDTIRDTVLQYTMVVFIILMLWLLQRQVKFLLNNGFKSCVTTTESVIRLVEIVTGLVLIAGHFSIIEMISDTNDRLQGVYRDRKELEAYVDFRPLATWDKDVMVTVEVCLATIILLHWLFESNRFQQLRGLAYVARRVGTVIILPTVTLACFEMTGKALFSTRDLPFADRGRLFNAIRFTQWATNSLPRIRDRPPITPDFIANTYFCILKATSEFVVINFFIIVINDLIAQFKMANVQQAREGTEPTWKKLKRKLSTFIYRHRQTELDSYHRPRRYSRRRSIQAETRWHYQNQFVYR